MRILGFGTYDIAKHPRVGIVLDGLRDHGDEVVEANAPVGFTTTERVAMLQKPWLALRLVPRLLRSWRSITRDARRAGGHTRWDAVIVGYLGHFDVILARILFPQDTVVLDLLIFAADTARDRGIDSGVKLKLLGLLDGLAVRCADIIMVDTVEHLELLPPSQRDKGVVVPVGASGLWFEVDDGGPRSSPSGPLRVIFFGHFTPLQGAVVIGEALGQLANEGEIETTMVGHGQDSARARSLATDNDQVTWVDWVEPDALPAVVATHDVCLGIFGSTPKAKRVVPNKVFQGAAAGCAIVTSDTAPQRRSMGDAAVFVPPGDVKGLATALRQLSSDRDRVSTLRRAAHRRSSSEFTPAAIVVPLRRRLVAGDVSEDTA